MAGHRYLVTFGTAEFRSARERLISSAQSSAQFHDFFVWDDARLREDPTFPPTLLDGHPRGFGYWSWKPHIICEALTRVEEGDVVVYSDAGRYDGGYTIKYDLAPLLRFARQHDGVLPGVLMPHLGPNCHWTRRDCFVLMGCDTPNFWHYPQVQATFSIWTKSGRTMKIVGEWRDYCFDLRVVGDGENSCGLPNLPGFIEHRHDQSVLTNLVVRHALSPFVVENRPLDWLTARRPRSLSASLVLKKIDNVSAIASGASPVRLLFREWLRSKLTAVGHSRRYSTHPLIGGGRSGGE